MRNRGRGHGRAGFLLALLPRVAAPAGVSLALLGSVGVAGGGVRFDFEPRVYAPLDHYVKDHTIIRQGDVYHLITTTGTDPLGRWQEPGNEVHFGHATSSDLRHWTVEPPLLAGTRGEWEERNRWAPAVVRLPDGRFRLYYTGVNEHIAQAIGIAESPSLDPGVVHFVPLAENPVFHPDTSWARWQEDGASDGRDPQVFQYDGAWWMVVTAELRDGRGALALARSTDGGRRFEDQGPLLIGGDDELESPQLVGIEGRWFLLFTSGREGGTWVIEGPGPFGPWDYSARARWLETVAPEIWHADPSPSGDDSLGNESWWISTHQSYALPPAGERRYFLIGFDRLRTGPSGLEIVEESGLGADWPLVEGDAFARQPTLGDNPAARGKPGVGLVGRGYLGSSEWFTWPPDRPGRIRGYAATGRIRSRPFVLRGNAMSLRVGGSDNPDSVYVALIRTSDRAVLFRETGRGVDTMDERVWDIRPFSGSEAVIEIADLDPHGRINVDHIIEIENDLPGPATPVSRLIQASPNPFRESITLSIATPLAALAGARVTIHDARGRRIRALDPEGAGNGAAAVWDGLDNRGQAVASGVYFARFRTDGIEEVVRLVRVP